MSTHHAPARGLASLRRFVEKSPAIEVCELCAAHLAEQHQHLVDPQGHRILCACDACAILFSGEGQTQYRRVPRDIWRLDDFQMDDALWSSLMIPIRLVFFYNSSASGQTVALYPSPAGATESAIDAELWEEIIELNPALRSMRPDVEGLLVNRAQQEREYYLAPVDECYRLTGLIRKHWSGFSGGNEAWEAIAAYFATLRQRSLPMPLEAHA
ncbi:MAG TPA: DUF5947 family protein [Bryobacteraceae bacterium]|nr:DUF5947 family protein [Bryobacteraceae bacterium]